jgi:hypothetical protein
MVSRVKYIESPGGHEKIIEVVVPIWAWTLNVSLPVGQKGGDGLNSILKPWS